jgi:hypothetical protein
MESAARALILIFVCVCVWVVAVRYAVYPIRFRTDAIGYVLMMMPKLAVLSGLLTWVMIRSRTWAAVIGTAILVSLASEGLSAVRTAQSAPPGVGVRRDALIFILTSVVAVVAGSATAFWLFLNQMKPDDKERIVQ